MVSMIYSLEGTFIGSPCQYFPESTLLAGVTRMSRAVNWFAQFDQHSVNKRQTSCNTLSIVFLWIFDSRLIMDKGYINIHIIRMKKRKFKFELPKKEAVPLRTSFAAIPFSAPIVHTSCAKIVTKTPKLLFTIKNNCGLT